MTNHKADNGELHEAVVIAMDDQPETYDYPEEVQFNIQQEQQGDYIEAARFINAKWLRGL